MKRAKGLHIALWITQALLAAAFGMAGFMKISMPIEQLAQKGMGFVNHFSIEMVRFIGISEVLGALGLILPAALRFKPVLTPVAAVGIAIIMILAAFHHISQNEPFFPTLILLTLALFIAWGRFLKAPIHPK